MRTQTKTRCKQWIALFLCFCMIILSSAAVFAEKTVSVGDSTFEGGEISTVTVGKEVLREHELDTTISPAGTKINLFDYWLSDREEDRREPDHQPLNPDGTEYHDKDLAEDVERKSSGINKGHVLKFIAAGGNWQGYNRWTGNVNPYEKIVAKQLDANGYPVVAEEPKDFTWPEWNNNIYDTKNDKAGSLDYLFDPNIGHHGKKSFENVKNLLQIDDKGYYYYDAGKNYARFDEQANLYPVRCTGILPQQYE